MFTVTDLKQMAYCRRIPYFQYCLPGVHVAGTYKMQAGAEAGEDEETREGRRSLRAYGLKTGERAFGVALESEVLGLRGVLDMLITVPGGADASELIPVDYKNAALSDIRSSRARADVQRNWQIQLTAYALLAEAAWPERTPVRRGFIYYVPQRRAREVVFSTALREETSRLLGDLGAMVEGERMPEPTEHRARCAACEYRRLCNDV